MSAHPAPKEVFLSYAKADEKLAQKLMTHLSVLEREGLITIWHTGQIGAGTNRDEEISEHFSTASIILLLLSADFMKSDYCYNVMQQALERHHAQDAFVALVILRPMDDWQNNPIRSLPALPSDGAPVTKWTNSDAAFADVARGIRFVLQEGKLPPFSSAQDEKTRKIRSTGKEKATYRTRRDYLDWLIKHNSYLDHSITFQTKGQRVKLDEVYISLEAEAEELEDRDDQLRMRFSKRPISERQGEVLELVEVVTRHDRVMILGDLGSGKTTLLRYLALKHAEALRDGHREVEGELGVARFPILVRIAEYAEDGTWKRTALSEFLAECFRIQACPHQGLADLLQNELDNGNCLILLDGLDEIVSADDRVGVVRQIENFVRRYAGRSNHFVITSRIVGYRRSPLGEPFAHYRVRAMDEWQMYDFLAHWFQASENTQTSQLSPQERQNAVEREINGLMDVLQNPGVYCLAVNPLMLMILAFIYRKKGRLPQKRIELYRFAADTLARTWRTQRVSEKALVEESTLFKEEYLTPLLSRLAYWLHINKPTGTATKQEVSDALGEELARLNKIPWDADDPDPKNREEIGKFFDVVHKHTGLLVERPPRRYGFMHLIFEEYYAARYLAARRRKWTTLIRQHLHQPRWEEPILRALGFIELEYNPEAAGELIETAILAQGEKAKVLGFGSSKYEDLLGRDYLFALRCLCDNVSVGPELLSRLVGRLANELLYCTGPASFQRYRKALDERLASLPENEGASRIIPLFVSALKNENKYVRYNAAGGLGLVGAGSSTAFYPHCSRLSMASQMTGRMNFNALLIDAAFDLTSADYYEEIRGVYPQKSWVTDRSPEAVNALITALKDPIDFVRLSAVVSLGRLGASSSEVVNALIATLKDENEYVRKGVTWSLSRLASGSPPEAVSLLVAALTDENASIRRGAAESLGQAKADLPEVVRALEAVLKDRDMFVQRNAAKSLVQMGTDSPEVVRVLLAELKHSCQNEYNDTLKSLAKVGLNSPEMVRELVTVLKDRGCRGSGDLRLGQVGLDSPEIVKALITILNDEDAHMRRQAVEYLGEMEPGSPEAVNALIAVLKDDAVCCQAVVSLGHVGAGSPEVVNALAAVALTDSDVQVRRNAVKVLGQMEPSSSESLLRHPFRSRRRKARRLEDPNNGKKVVMRWSRSPEAVNALIAALTDADRFVRHNAAESLGRMGAGSPEAVDALIATLKDIDDWMHEKAAESLGQVGAGSPEAVNALAAVALTDSNARRRENAIRGLGKMEPGSLEVVNVLIAALTDYSVAASILQFDGASPVCFWAVVSLGQVGAGSPKAVNALAAVACTGNNASVRWRAIASLGKMEPSPPELDDILVAALKDEDLSVRHEAAKRLGSKGISSPDVIEPLCEALDGTIGYSLDAAELLGRIGDTDKATLDMLLRWALYDPSGCPEGIQKACVQALIELTKRYPRFVDRLQTLFVQAIQSNRAQTSGETTKCIYEGLWLLVAEDER